MQKLLLTAILIYSLCSGSKAKLCPENSNCQQIIANHQLFNSQYKMAANYVPILPLRAMVHADVYKAKKPLTMDRRYYIKGADGKYVQYQKTFLNIDIKGHGIIGREIDAEGTLNDYPIKYRNVMSFSLPKKANMKVNASLDGVPILELSIQSDGKKMTNKVKGTYLGKTVDYQTNWRETKGTLAGIPYQLHTEGLIKEVDVFKAVTKGTIANYLVTGEVHMIDHSHFESTEYYGPIMVQTKITILGQKN